MNISKDALGIFIAVLDKGSFSAAARSLGKVPSAVSMSIANLETDLGMALFERRGREPVPNAAARALEAKARFMLEQFAQWEAQAMALSEGLEGRLSIAIDPELLACDWTSPLSALSLRYPLLEIEILAAPQIDAMSLLHDGRVQLALVFERPDFDGREGFQEMTSETLVSVIAPNHPAVANGGRPRLEDLAEHRQIVVASRERAQPNPRFLSSHRHWRTDNHTAALSLMQAGLGWGQLPLSLVRPYLNAGTLVEIDLANMSNSCVLWVDVVWNKSRPLGLGAQHFIALIRDQQKSIAR